MHWRGRPKTKYGNSSVASVEVLKDHPILGGSYMSKLEAAVAIELYLRERAGEIEVLGRQTNVFLTQSKIRSIPDFKCRRTADGVTFFVEAKGHESERWLIVKKLWEFYGPGDLWIYKGSHLKPILHGIIQVQHTKFLPELTPFEYEKFIAWKKNQEPQV